MILGIDPGLFGAIALYDPDTNTVVSAENIPVLLLTRNGKQKNSIDIQALLNRLRAVAPNATHAWLENVNAMPGQGVTSMFSFGRTYGCIETAVCACDMPLDRVTPQAWKRALRVPADKDGARARASELMPKSAELWTPKRGHATKQQCEGIAEAALIAYYGAEQICLDG